MYIVPDADLPPFPVHVTSCDLTVVISDEVVPFESAFAEIDETDGATSFVPLAASATIEVLPESKVLVI